MKPSARALPNAWPRGEHAGCPLLEASPGESVCSWNQAGVGGSLVGTPAAGLKSVNLSAPPFPQVQKWRQSPEVFRVKSSAVPAVKDKLDTVNTVKTDFIQ